MAEYTRGECQCYADLAANGKPIILKCPLCKAAPNLYEACKQMIRDWDSGNIEIDHKTRETIKKALAKAEGSK